MLKYVKRQIAELLQTLTEARQDVMAAIRGADGAGLMNLLADIQDAAVAIGGRIEEAEGLHQESAEGCGAVAEGPPDTGEAAQARPGAVGAVEACSGAGEAAQARPGAVGAVEECSGAGEAAQARPSAVGAVEACPGAGEAAEARPHAEDMAPAREVVLLLESFCEFLWRITQEQNPGQQQALAEEAWELLGRAGRRLEQIPVQMAMVFMPYKASMWDSLESVWQAACKDPACVPFVVPIPYFDLKDGQITARHYEGESFPDYVPVVDYGEFPLEELHPDAVFIHNPFDDCNTVTTVLPQFYSGELKKVSDRVIYIPYFITGDGVYVTHRYFPSYDRVDFIVTQCEKTIDSFAAELPRGKFLPYGSPIADRVLRLEREKPDIPEGWKAQLKNGRDFGGDRVVMLNTSITMMMGQRERFLEKLEYLMELAKQQEGISLVWRPHPLLAATAKNMGEEYAARLARLEDKFLREKIGVLDKTPDVGVTVALCDAYLGETASSVLHMFGIAGKPRFYISMRIWEEASGGREAVCTGERDGKADTAHPAGQDETGEADAAGYTGWHETGATDSAYRYEDDGNRIFASARCRAGEKEYYVLDRPGWIVEKEEGTGKYVPVVRIPGRDIVWGRAYRGMEMKEDNLWVYPETAEGTFIYHIGSGRMRKAFGAEESQSCQGDRVSQESQSRRGDWDCQESQSRQQKAGSWKTQYPAPGEFSGYLEVDEACLAIIKAEKFKRGNRDHVWYEGENARPGDFFRFLRTAGDEELIGPQGAYPTWLANLDGTCGEKVLQAVKASCAEENHGMK